jgi:hypothetical protein
VEAIPEDLDLRAAKLVDAQREEIEAVAEALRKRRYLDASEVAEIVGAVAGKTPSWPVSENRIVFRTRALALNPPLNGCLWSQCGGAALRRPGGGRRRPMQTMRLSRDPDQNWLAQSAERRRRSIVATTECLPNQTTMVFVRPPAISCSSNIFHLHRWRSGASTIRPCGRKLRRSSSQLGRRITPGLRHLRWRSARQRTNTFLAYRREPTSGDPPAAALRRQAKNALRCVQLIPNSCRDSRLVPRRYR